MAAAEPLTATHRQAQLVLRAAVVKGLHRLWPAMDFGNLDRAFPAWATAVTLLIRQNRLTSANLAAAYYRAFRFGQGITEPPTIVLASAVPAAKLKTVLQVTTIAGVKAATSHGITRDQAMANAFVRSSGAISRLVLEGGRETIRQTSIADPSARGWERVTGGRSCSFCSMLASRGGVYGEESADFQAHDHCGCTAQPVFA